MYAFQYSNSICLVPNNLSFKSGLEMFIEFNRFWLYCFTSIRYNIPISKTKICTYKIAIIASLQYVLFPLLLPFFLFLLLFFLLLVHVVHWFTSIANAGQRTTCCCNTCVGYLCGTVNCIIKRFSRSLGCFPTLFTNYF